jgi:hypothetical protein
MAESKYSKYVIKDLKGKVMRDGKEVEFEGIFLTPEKLGTKCQFLYSIQDKARVDEATPHIHDFPIIMTFVGANPRNIFDFDAEIEFYIGGEKQVITSPASISVPAGTAHCPLIFKRVGKPFAWMEIMLTDNYSRREVGTGGKV